MDFVQFNILSGFSIKREILKSIANAINVEKTLNKMAESDKTDEDIYQLRVCLGQLNALFGLERLTFSHYKSSSSAQWAAAATVCPFLKS